MGVHASITRVLGVKINEKNYKDFVKQFPIPDKWEEPTEKRLSEDISFEDFQNAVKDVAIGNSDGYENFFCFSDEETITIIFGLSLCDWSSKLYSQFIDLEFDQPSEEEMDIFNCTEEEPEIYTWFGIST